MNQWEQDQENARIKLKIKFDTHIHPEQGLYKRLVEYLPKYVRIIDKLSKKNFDLPLNDKGLPF